MSGSQVPLCYPTPPCSADARRLLGSPGGVSGSTVVSVGPRDGLELKLDSGSWDQHWFMATLSCLLSYFSQSPSFSPRPYLSWVPQGFWRLLLGLQLALPLPKVGPPPGTGFLPLCSYLCRPRASPSSVLSKSFVPWLLHLRTAAEVLHGTVGVPPAQSGESFTIVAEVGGLSAYLGKMSFSL